MDIIRRFIQESKEELALVEKKNDNIIARLFNKLKSIFFIKLNNSKDNKTENDIEMIIFDLDGTLWSTDVETVQSVNEYLKNNNIGLEVSLDVIRKTMGCTFEDAAYNYFPSLEKKQREELLDEVLRYNNMKILENGGSVYTNVEQTLETLKKHYKLSIVSNCGEGYIEAFLESSNLNRYFCDFIAASKEKLSKADAIKLMIERNDIKSAIYVGDTDKDKVAAEGADIEFIQALYGFGDDLNTKYSIDSFENLPNMLENLSF